MSRQLTAGLIFSAALLAHQDAHAANVASPGEIRVHLDYGVAQLGGMTNLEMEGGELVGEINRRGRVNIRSESTDIPTTSIDTIGGRFEIIPRVSRDVVCLLYTSDAADE